MNEQEGGGEPQATAIQQSHEKTPYQTEGPHKSRSQDSVSHTQQEDLDRVRISAAKLKSVVKKPDPPAALTVSQATPEPSPRRKDWNKRSKKEHFTAHDEDKARNIAAANKDNAKLMGER